MCPMTVRMPSRLPWLHHSVGGPGSFHLVALPFSWLFELLPSHWGERGDWSRESTSRKLDHPSAHVH